MVDHKPSSSEDEYFARESAEKKRKLAHEQAKALEVTQKEELKKLHFMHCPKCGLTLQSVKFKSIEIDKCFACGVTVFDAGELEKIGVAETGETAMKSILRIFK